MATITYDLVARFESADIDDCHRWFHASGLLLTERWGYCSPLRNGEARPHTLGTLCYANGRWLACAVTAEHLGAA